MELFEGEIRLNGLLSSLMVCTLSHISIMVKVKFSGKDASGNDQFVSTVELVEKCDEYLTSLCPGSVFGNRKCCMEIKDRLFVVLDGKLTLKQALDAHNDLELGMDAIMHICFIMNGNVKTVASAGDCVLLPIRSARSEYVLLLNGKLMYDDALAVWRRTLVEFQGKQLVHCRNDITVTKSHDLMGLNARQISERMFVGDYLFCGLQTTRKRGSVDSAESMDRVPKKQSALSAGAGKMPICIYCVNNTVEYPFRENDTVGDVLERFGSSRGTRYKFYVSKRSVVNARQNKY